MNYRARHSEFTGIWFHEKQGGLKNFWYPFCFEGELKGIHRPLRKVVLGRPLVLWRTVDGKIRAFTDVCPHRQAPLSEGKVDAKGIRCPYHGWGFDEQGRCYEIPGVPDSESACKKISLVKVPVIIGSGMIWIWAGHKPPEGCRDGLISPGSFNFSNYQVRKRAVFDVSVEDLIENFMDPFHTGVVHTHLIRKESGKNLRKINISLCQDRVTSEHLPSEEPLGFFSRFINPENDLVTHIDTFHLPSSVEVSYQFGESGGKFKAFLAMNPVEEHKTELFLTMGVRFGKADWLLSKGLSLLSNIILKQDKTILEKQRWNLCLNPDVYRYSLRTDTQDLYIRRLRHYVRDGKREEIRERRIVTEALL